jgi:hypothetical protein
MARFLAGVLIVIVLAVGAIYLAGWMNFQATDNTATIEIDTGKMKQAAEKAGERAQEVIKDSQKAIEGTASPPASQPNIQP